MAKEDESRAKHAPDEQANALAARRARLRSSLSKGNPPSEVSHSETQADFSVDVNKINSGNVLSSEGQAKTLALLSNIDQALGSCAAQLASLQKVAGKQIDELKTIAQALQKNTFSEISPGLNTLTESLAAAIEPMKAVGELVPTLHRLGELIGEQHPSIEKFPDAHEAKQEQYDQGFRSQIAEDMPYTEARDFIREEELVSQLNAKDEEITALRAQLDQKWQELANECEELKLALQQREEILQNKEFELNKKATEISAKDSENQQLRTQMEELRDQTKEMVTDLQKQLAERHMQEMAEQAAKAQVAPQPVQQSFFDFVEAPSTGNNLFDQAAINPSLPEEETKQPEPEAIKKQSQATIPVSAAASAPVQTSEPALPNPTTSFVSAAGSYGSGVRAQVFEVIVRQALAGTQWREICAVPMQINNISPDEVEAEVKRRQALLSK